MQTVLDALSWTFLVTGSLFAIVGGIGILRFPDLFSRMHAAGITDTLGAVLILTGLMFQAGFTLATAKLITILFFFLITSPTSTHALAEAAIAEGTSLIGREER